MLFGVPRVCVRTNLQHMTGIALSVPFCGGLRGQVTLLVTSRLYREKLPMVGPVPVPQTKHMQGTQFSPQVCGYVCTCARQDAQAHAVKQSLHTKMSCVWWLGTAKCPVIDIFHPSL